MNAEWLVDGAMPPKSLPKVDYASRIFAARGIFPRDKGFYCQVCNKVILYSNEISFHIAENSHCRDLKVAKAGHEEINGRFACKLCTNYLAPDWQTFLCHFHEKDHFKESNNENSLISFITLARNQIIERECGIYFCCCCKELIVGDNLILQHISENQHKELQETHHKDMYIRSYNEKATGRFIRHSIFHVAASTFHCEMCDCSLTELEKVWPHIQCKEHMYNFMIKGNTEHLCQLENTNEKSEIPSPKLIIVETSDCFDKLIRENFITRRLQTNVYECKLCSCVLSGPQERNITEHIAGKQHRYSMQINSDKLKLVSESEKTSNGSSSSWESPVNSSESWETYAGESQSSKSYEKSSCSAVSSDNITDSWETISIVSDVNTNQNLFPISPELIPLLSKHNLHHLEQEILCILCNAHLRNESSLIDHTRSVQHIKKLKKYENETADVAEELCSISRTSHTANSCTNILKNKPSQPASKCKTVTDIHPDMVKNARNPQLSPFETLTNLSSLMSKHPLVYQNNEIFCVACDARLQSVTSLKGHIKSRNHCATSKLYKAKIDKKHKINSSHLANLQSSPFKSVENLSLLMSEHLLQYRKNEIFCPACDVRLQSVTSLTAHTKSEYHHTTLTVYKAQIAKDCRESGDRSGKNSSANSNCNKQSSQLISTEIYTPTISSRGTSLQSAAASESHTTVNIPMDLTTEKPANIKYQNNSTTLKAIATNPQMSQSSRMDISKKLLPLITIHRLEHLANDIYCVACQVHLRNESSLVSHTSSRRHASRLESFLASLSTKKQNSELSVSLQPNVMEAYKELKSMKENIGAKLKQNQSRQTGLENPFAKLNIKERTPNLGNLPSLSKRLKNSVDHRPPKNARSRKQNTRQKQNRPFDPKYLMANMEHIYEVNPEKLRTIKLSCQLCFTKTSNTAYCLVCEKTVPSKVQTFYEHICGKEHTVYLADMEQNNKHFINYPDQFSDIALAKEFMQEGQGETIQCFPCDELVENEDIDIHEHIKKDSHKEQKRLWNEQMEKIFQNILVEMKSTWYNTQKYWCVLCDMEYNTEFLFAEHMDSKGHNNCIQKISTSKKKLIYDSCLSCATLWLGFSGIYAHHCEQPMHKYLVQSGDFSVYKLPNQAVTLLQNAIAEVTNLIELSDQVLTVQKVNADALLKCLEDTVKPTYPDVKAYPFGSRVSGLGFPNSDLDVFLDCGTYHGCNMVADYQQQLIMTVEQCLYGNRKSWEIEETLVSTRTPIIKLRHRDTELRCDVSFKNGLSVENTKLLKCFIDNYPLCRKLMLFLKKWFSLCNLSGSQFITNYATCWYVIFYLQCKSILPSVASLIAMENKSKLIDKWETGIAETFDVNEQEFTFTELLCGFFDFYTNFDFRESVACPIIGRTIRKQDFTELDLLPKEMAPYVHHVVTRNADGSVELFRIDSEMCIQDPYDLSHNLTKAVRKFTLNRFRRLCAASAELLNKSTQY